MNHFEYRQDELFCEDVPVKLIAKKVGTPLYLYSHATLKRHFMAFYNAFKGIKTLVCYSAKANTNLAVLKLFADLGSGLDIVSGGELYKGLKAGFKPEKIVYSGVGKRADEIDLALETGILMFNAESIEELELIDQRAGLTGVKAPVAIRVNPDVDPKTHPYISTGMKKNKFGITAKASIEAYKLAKSLKHIDIKGIDCHIGSQITQLQPFADALENVKTLIGAIKTIGIDIEYLDIGGGLGITYDDEAPPLPDEYAKIIINRLKDMDIKLIIEPGRAIVGNAGILVTKTLYRKSGENKEFIIVDAGMNDLLRPSIYNAFHGVNPVVKKNKEEQLIKADIVGPICESGDFLAADRYVPDFKSGDLVAIMSAGAYGFTMSSNYCSRLKPAEVMVKKDDFEIIRQRQEYEELIKGESIPLFL